MEALAQTNIPSLGNEVGDLVRDKYSVRLLENGGIETNHCLPTRKTCEVVSRIEIH